jgi:hypothetical protein
MGKKEYWEIGYDLDGKQRMGSWQIKEIVDLSLQPRERIEERFLSELPENTKSAEVEVKVTMFPTPQMELLIHRVMKKLDFEK